MAHSAHARPSAPPSDYPPTVFVSMVRDENTKPKIENDVKVLRNQGTPTEVIEASGAGGGRQGRPVWGD